MNDKCFWIRCFDGNFNISCPSGERGNGEFKKDKIYQSTKLDFKYCPYCGREIDIDREENEQ